MAKRAGTALRSGFTTGACAAAAAKGAVVALFSGSCPESVTIGFPDGGRRTFTLHRCEAEQGRALASVIKDAGDDPDVTNGAEIGVRCRPVPGDDLHLAGGPGVGRVTKPGLPVAVGEPAINPVPRRMIRGAVAEGLRECGQRADAGLEVEVFVTGGEKLAEHTLNHRLGIVGGISILGTTGIVRPLSTRAWTETVESTMRVARAAGLDSVLLSTGRTSEASVQRELRLPEEAQVMMGDYLRYSLEAAGRHGFLLIHLAMMWGKMIKAALAIPQTHVRHGALEPSAVAALLVELGLPGDAADRLAGANTARQILQSLQQEGRMDIVGAVLHRTRIQAEAWSGIPVRVYLVTSERKVIRGA